MNEALFFARLAKAAYLETNPDQWLGVTNVRRFADKDTDTQGFVCETTKANIIVFRGTEASSWRDVLTDLMVRKMPFLGGNVHRGFHHAFVSVESKIPTFGLPSEGEKQREKVIIGHSLGGALAQLCALWFGCDRLVTFGSPRVGDKQWSYRIAEKQHERYVSRGDPVPHVPIWNYWHGCPAIKIGKGWDISADHPMDSYIEALKNG